MDVPSPATCVCRTPEGQLLEGETPVCLCMCVQTKHWCNIGICSRMYIGLHPTFRSDYSKYGFVGGLLYEIEFRKVLC